MKDWNKLFSVIESNIKISWLFMAAKRFLCHIATSYKLIYRYTQWLYLIYYFCYNKNNNAVFIQIFVLLRSHCTTFTIGARNFFWMSKWQTGMTCQAVIHHCRWQHKYRTHFKLNQIMIKCYIVILLPFSVSKVGYFSRILNH